MKNFSDIQGSQGKIVIGHLDFDKTIWAASGSAKKLNSAAREKLPTP